MTTKKKKVFNSTIARITTNSGVRPHKKGSLLQNLRKKTVLDHEFWGDKQYFGGLSLRTALQWYLACHFLWGTILAWGGSILVWGITSTDLGGTAPKCPPSAESDLSAPVSSVLRLN